MLDDRQQGALLRGGERLPTVGAIGVPGRGTQPRGEAPQPFEVGSRQRTRGQPEAVSREQPLGERGRRRRPLGVPIVERDEGVEQQRLRAETGKRLQTRFHEQPVEHGAGLRAVPS